MPHTVHKWHHFVLIKKTKNKTEKSQKIESERRNKVNEQMTVRVTVKETSPDNSNTDRSLRHV